MKTTNIIILELITEFSRVTGYKVYTQKSITFLYTNNEYLETEIKTILFTNIKLNT